MTRLIVGAALLLWFVVLALRAAPGSAERRQHRGFAALIGVTLGLDAIPEQFSVTAVVAVILLVGVALWALREVHRAVGDLRAAASNRQ